MESLRFAGDAMCAHAAKIGGLFRNGVAIEEVRCGTF